MDPAPVQASPHLRYHILRRDAQIAHEIETHITAHLRVPTPGTSDPFYHVPFAISQKHQLCALLDRFITGTERASFPTATGAPPTVVYNDPVASILPSALDRAKKLRLALYDSMLGNKSATVYDYFGNERAIKRMRSVMRAVRALNPIGPPPPLEEPQRFDGNGRARVVPGSRARTPHMDDPYRGPGYRAGGLHPTRGVGGKRPVPCPNASQHQHQNDMPPHQHHNPVPFHLRDPMKVSEWESDGEDVPDGGILGCPKDRIDTRMQQGMTRLEAVNDILSRAASNPRGLHGEWNEPSGMEW